MRPLFLFLALSLPATLPAQQDDPHPPPDNTPGHGLLNLGLGHTGISFGNSARWTGLRINLRDRGVRRVDGINLTIWKAANDANRHAVLRGVAVGLVGPEAGSLTGVNLGVVGVLADRRMSGLNLGGLGLISEGALDGINVAGLGLVSAGRARGLSLAGLGVVADGGIQGISLSGLGTVSSGGIRGVGIGGIAVVAEGGIIGAGIAGLAVVSSGGLRGIGVGGLALVAEHDLLGVGIGGLAVVTEQGIRGLALSAGEINAARVEGLALTAYRIRVQRQAFGMLAAGWIKARETYGLTIAPYNQILGAQHGLAIGIFNSATELHGVQLGLLNRARNNKPPFRLLPVLNLHLH